MPSSHNETNVRRMAKRYGIDFEAYDWRAHWDSALGEDENMARVRKDFEKLADPILALKIKYEDMSKKDFESIVARDEGRECTELSKQKQPNKKKLKEVGIG